MELETIGYQLPSMYNFTCMVAKYLIPPNSREEEKEAFTKLLHAYLTNMRRQILNDIDLFEAHRFDLPASLSENKYLTSQFMNNNRTFIINGNYYENNGHLHNDNGPVQYNIHKVSTDKTEFEHKTAHSSKDIYDEDINKPKTEYNQVSKLSEMIDESMIRQYKNYFDKSLAPYIVSSNKDPMTVINMKFTKALSKDKIYSAFGNIFNFVKDDYDKWDMANYMYKHLENMPKVESIYRKL